jgi:hypothetical protein
VPAACLHASACRSTSRAVAQRYSQRSDELRTDYLMGLSESYDYSGNSSWRGRHLDREALTAVLIIPSGAPKRRRGWNGLLHENVHL